MDRSLLVFFLCCIQFFSCKKTLHKKLSSNVIIIQPIITQSDIGDEPSKINLSKRLVNRAYSKLDLDFHYLEPIYFNNTNARDGKINLDSIVSIAREEKILRGQGDIINMFFVNAIDGNKGPTGRGMMNGNLVFITLGDDSKYKGLEKKYVEAFVVAHEIGHNLGLKHAIDDPNVNDSLPNIQGDGEFEDRIDPKFSLNHYQIEQIKKSPLFHSRINFLTSIKAKKAILDETFEPYFSKLQTREITTFVQQQSPSKIDSARKFAREKFSSAVMEFSEKEKKILSFVVKKTNDWLLQNKINLMARQPWRFIKIQNWLCGGFAHTRGTFIILSQAYLDKLSTNWSEKMDKNNEAKLVTSLGGLLVHEQMHSLQRTFKTKFDKLYSEKWKFVKQIVKVENEITLNQVSNPDAPLAEWLIQDPQNENKFFWLRTLLKKNIEIPKMGRDFIDLAFHVEEKNEEYFVLKSENKLVNQPLQELSFYTKSYPVSRGLDHPNEISAYMFSEFFKSKYNSSEPFHKINESSKKNTRTFIEWIKTDMK